jgi:hypothetical protein
MFSIFRSQGRTYQRQLHSYFQTVIAMSPREVHPSDECLCLAILLCYGPGQGCKAHHHNDASISIHEPPDRPLKNSHPTTILSACRCKSSLMPRGAVHGCTYQEKLARGSCFETTLPTSVKRFLSAVRTLDAK